MTFYEEVNSKQYNYQNTLIYGMLHHHMIIVPHHYGIITVHVNVPNYKVLRQHSIE